MSAGSFVRAPPVEAMSHSEESDEQEVDYLDNMESGFVGATEEVEYQECGGNDEGNRSTMEKPSGWRYSAQPSGHMQVANSTCGGTRLDNAPHFPKNVPTNRLWEEWYRFLGKFEIAASLSNVTEPAQLAKHLFMCMGDELQDIVSFAKLKPGWNDPGCYQAMVDNINLHLRKLTDPVTVHETFSRMTQGKDETILSFHARLKSKVRLCEYSDQDEDRFVHTQLLKGMRDRKLAEDGRIYGHGIDLIVKAAARKEAFTVATFGHNSLENGPEVHAVSRKPPQENQPFRKRSGNTGFFRQEKQRYVGNRYQGRRFRCWRCDSSEHTHKYCPARNRKCLECGKVGHFESTCRRKRIRNIHTKEEKGDAPSGWTDDENQSQV